MDYLCAKFGDFSFSRFCFIMRTDTITEADQRCTCTRATTVGVSNYVSNANDAKTFLNILTTVYFISAPHVWIA